MDDSVIRSMLKWPGVPAVYGWLALDRRGNWRVRASAAEEARFETIGNPALREFIGRNYQADERGCWYFQNGPQRVFVLLAYAPLVFRLEGGALVDQCGRIVRMPRSAWLDEEGSLALCSESGAGLLDDRDLGAFAEGLEGGYFVLGGAQIALGLVRSGELEARFGYVRDPQP